MSVSFFSRFERDQHVIVWASSSHYFSADFSPGAPSLGRNVLPINSHRERVSGFS